MPTIAHDGEPCRWEYAERCGSSADGHQLGLLGGIRCDKGPEPVEVAVAECLVEEGGRDGLGVWRDGCLSVVR